MSNLKSKYLYTFPSTSSIYARRLANIRNSRRAINGTPNQNVNNSTVNEMKLIKTTEPTTTRRTNNTTTQTTTTTATMTSVEGIPSRQPMIMNKAIDETNNGTLNKMSIENTKHSGQMNQTKIQNLVNSSDTNNLNSMSGVDLDGKFFLVFPKNNENIIDQESLVPDPSNNSSIVQTSKLLNFPTFNDFNSFDSTQDIQKNFDFLELPKIHLFNDEDDFSNEVQDSFEDIDDLDDSIPVLNSQNDQMKIYSVEDLFRPFDLDTINPPPLNVDNTVPLGLEGFVDSEEFYDIVTNILKLETPLDIKNTLFSPTGVPLPPINAPEITTIRPQNSFVVDTILQNPVKQKLDDSLVEIFPTGVPLPNPELDLKSENSTNINTIDSSTLVPEINTHDLPIKEDFDIPKFNPIDLMNTIDINKFNNNSLTALSQTWKMSNKTATIIFVLLSSLVEAMKFNNGHGLAQDFNVNSRPDPFDPKLFSTPFFTSTPIVPTSLPVKLSTSDPRKSIPKSLSSFCDPQHPPACAKNSSSFCIEDPFYPLFEVESLLKNDPTLVDKYADVSDQTANDLVAHMSARQENKFDYSYYNPGIYDVTHWIGPEGYLCPSQVEYTTPRRARNVKGEWRVIVNDGHFYTQTARLETCLYPLTPCRLLAPCFKTKCIQKYIYHRLLSMDVCHPEKGLFIDMYRLPAACSCYAPAMLT